MGCASCERQWSALMQAALAEDRQGLSPISGISDAVRSERGKQTLRFSQPRHHLWNSRTPDILDGLHLVISQPSIRRMPALPESLGRAIRQ